MFASSSGDASDDGDGWAVAAGTGPLTSRPVDGDAEFEATGSATWSLGALPRDECAELVLGCLCLSERLHLRAAGRPAADLVATAASAEVLADTLRRGASTPGGPVSKFGVASAPRVVRFEGHALHRQQLDFLTTARYSGYRLPGVLRAAAAAVGTTEHPVADIDVFAVTRELAAFVASSHLAADAPRGVVEAAPRDSASSLHCADGAGVAWPDAEGAPLLAVDATCGVWGGLVERVVLLPRCALHFTVAALAPAATTLLCFAESRDVWTPSAIARAYADRLRSIDVSPGTVFHAASADRDLVRAVGLPLGQELRALQHLCPGLVRFDCSNTNGGVSGAELAALVRASPLLRDLAAYRAGGSVTDAVLDALAAGCPLLTRLDIGATHGSCSDAGIAAVVRSCRKLRALNVEDSSGCVTDAAIVLLAEHAPELRALSVAGTCGRVTDAAVAAVVAACSGLEFVDARRTHGAIGSMPLPAGGGYVLIT